MTKAPPARSALPPLSLTATALLGALLVLWKPAPLLPLRLVGQAFLLVVLLRAFCYWPPARLWWGAMPSPHRFVLVLLLGGMIAGHFTLATHRYFPFVAWEIFPFVHEDNPVTCREFLATTASGRTVRLLVERLFPSIVQFNPPADDDSPTLRQLVEAMARVYNRRHPTDPVRSVDLVRIAVPLHPAPGAPLSSCEPIHHYEILPGPLN